MVAVLVDSLRKAVQMVAVDFYSDCVTFEMAKECNQDGLIVRKWKPVPHPHYQNEYLIDLPCCLAPDATMSGQAERKIQTHTRSSSRQKLALAEYYPNITKTFRAVVNGNAWNIVGIANDNQAGMLIFLDETST